MARSLISARHFATQFKAHNVEKRYVCLCDGKPQKSKGIIDLPLRKYGHRMCVDPKGLPAMTAYQLLAYQKEKNVSLICCAPSSGRKHQIRVHCAAYGMPLRGDPSYHPQKSKAPFCLHAIEMRYQDLEGKQIITHAPLPETFKAALKEANIKATPISNLF